jgi:hypothetical protein
MLALSRHPQKMMIMNLVWPITAFYFSVFALWSISESEGRWVAIQ